MYKIKTEIHKMNFYEIMANLAKINENKKLAKYRFDKMVLNKRRNYK